MDTTLELFLLAHQHLFITSPERVVLLDGGFGAGKTKPLCEWAINECEQHPNNLILLGRHEYTDLADSTILSFFEALDAMQFPRNFNQQAKVYTHHNGSQVLFRHLDDEAGLKNLNLGGVGIDQAEEIQPDRFDLLLGRLRRPQSARTMRLTANPNGHDWLWQLFYGRGSTLWCSPHIRESVMDSPDYREGYHVIRCTSLDNPHLPDDYLKGLLKDYSEDFVQQYVYGSREVMLGYRFFDRAALSLQQVKVPLSTGYFVDGAPKPEWREQVGGAIRVYEAYDERDVYALGVDIATGEGSSRCASVLRNCRMNRVAAVLDEDLRPDELAVQSWLMSRAFGNAVIAPERNGLGFAVVTALQQLTSNLFSEQLTEFGVGTQTSHLGWWTDAKSRMELFAQLQREISHKAIELNDRELIEQCRAITMIKGRPKAEAGFRDDLVMACGIAGMVRKLRPAMAQSAIDAMPTPDLPKSEWGSVYGFGRRTRQMAGR